MLRRDARYGYVYGDDVTPCHAAAAEESVDIILIRAMLISLVAR